MAAAHGAADVARRGSSPAYEVLALQTALELGDHTVADRLFELVATVEGERAPTAALQAAALAAEDGDGLLAAADRWQELGDLLAAADAAASAALVFRRQGRRGSDSTAVARAQRLSDACEGAHTPALTAAARPLPLTAREREIATLAARGLTNREIADRLVVSVRTVEGHVYRICNKLGVNERSALKPILERRAAE